MCVNVCTILFMYRYARARVQGLIAFCIFVCSCVLSLSLSLCIYRRVELLTNVLERVQGEISSAEKFREVMSEARVRVVEYRYVWSSCVYR